MGTPVHGKKGAVYLGANKVANITGWDGDYDNRFVDTFYCGDDFGSQVGGIATLRGTLKADTDITDTNGQAAIQSAVVGQTTIRLYLYVNATDYWEFDAHVQLTDSIDIGAVIKRTMKFMSSGTVTPPS